MNKFINNLEKKFGKYAIPNLTLYLVVLYAIGYVLELAPAQVNIISFLTLNPEMILRGQIWRLVTWLIIPPSRVSILVIITLLFYYFVGSNMERTLGTFRYNLFIISGSLLMIIGAFLAYFLNVSMYGIEFTQTYMPIISFTFSSYYLQQIVFLAFAILYPNVQVLLMFLIPIKVKYLGYFYGAFLAYQCFIAFIQRDYAVFFAIGSQFINLLLFYAALGKLNKYKPGEMHRRSEFQKNVRMAPKGVTRHKCAVCGRTEVTNPNLEFRFCSKCNGNYEYCQEHLFTHQHVK